LDPWVGKDLSQGVSDTKQQTLQSEITVNAKHGFQGKSHCKVVHLGDVTMTGKRKEKYTV
jgi:hypothetical protein